MQRGPPAARAAADWRARWAAFGLVALVAALSARADAESGGAPPPATAATPSPPMATRWIRQVGGIGDDGVTALAAAPDHSLRLAGRFEGEIDLSSDVLRSAGDSDAYLAALSPDGEPLWATRLGGAGFDTASALAVDADGNVALVGEFTGTMHTARRAVTARGGSGAHQLFVASFDRVGRLRWITVLGGPGWQVASSAAATADGGVLVAGTRIAWAARAATTATERSDVLVARVSRSGRVLWTTTLGGDGWHQGLAVTERPGGEVVVGGSFSGRLAEAHRVTPHDPASPSDRNRSGGVAAHSHLDSAGRGDGFVAGLSPDGQLRWIERLGGTGDDGVTALAVTSQGAVVAGGYVSGSARVGGTTLTSAGGTDGFVTEIDAGGQFLWAARRGDAGDDAVGTLAALPDGRLLMAGRVSGAPDLAGGRGPREAEVALLTPRGAALRATRLPGWFVTVRAAPGRPGSIALAGTFMGSAQIGGVPLSSRGSFDGFAAALVDQPGDAGERPAAR